MQQETFCPILSVMSIHPIVDVAATDLCVCHTDTISAMSCMTLQSNCAQALTVGHHQGSYEQDGEQLRCLHPAPHIHTRLFLCARLCSEHGMCQLNG